MITYFPFFETKYFMLQAKIKYAFCLFGVAFLLTSPTLSFAQKPISVHTTPRKILIGDQINLWLEYQQAGSKLPTIQWVKLPDSLNGMVWVEKGKTDTIQTKDSIILKQKLVLTSFDSGSYYIPSLPYSVSGKSFRTDSLLVQVQSLNVDTTKAFKPIKGVRDLPISWLDYWKQFLLGIAILALFVFLIIYFIRKRRNKKAESPKVPPEKAHERALRLLAELEKRQLWQSGEIKAYYDNLSQIIREYLENRFHMSALEKTTDELLRTTHKMADLKPFRKQLRMILQTADLAKFARANPLPEEHEACIKAVEEIVIKTKMNTGEGEQ